MLTEREAREMGLQPRKLGYADYGHSSRTEHRLTVLVAGLREKWLRELHRGTGLRARRQAA